MAYEVLTGNGAAGVYDGTEPRVGLQSMNKIRNSFISHESRLVIAENYLDNLPGTVVGTTDAQTLTNKTISLTGNTISGALPLANLPTNFAQTFRAIVNVTNAQMLGLHTTPVAMVAAPGAGLMILPHRTLYLSSFASGAYTNIDAAASLFCSLWGAAWDSNFIVNDAAARNAPAMVNALLGSTTKRGVLVRWPYFYDDTVNDWGVLTQVKDIAAATNVPFNLALDNGGSGALTGGHASNILRTITDYAIIAVP